MRVPRLLITSGEPAGIGPDLVIQLAQEAWPAELVVIADPKLLEARAKRLNLSLILEPFDEKAAPLKQRAGSLKLLPLSLAAPCHPGVLNAENAAYVLRSLELAAELALRKEVDAIVTAPVHKGILNDAGFAFRGHTEFFADKAGSSPAVMLFVTKHARVALATTHLPLAAVPAAITAESLEHSLRVLHQALGTDFGLAKPTILVCGLNPHAGEGGHLGREEIDIIAPLIEKLRGDMKLEGPLSADTIFTEKYLKKADAILALYHDQALPVVKYMGFGNAVNVTLGLPFIRTSVDHGTALDVAGTMKADPGSLKAALELALDLAQKSLA